MTDVLEEALRLHAAGDLAGAEARYESLVAVDLGHAMAWNLLGVVAHQHGRHERAVALCESALALDPYLVEARNNLGIARAALGDYEGAILNYCLGSTGWKGRASGA